MPARSSGGVRTFPNASLPKNRTGDFRATSGTRAAFLLSGSEIWIGGNSNEPVHYRIFFIGGVLENYH